MNEERIDDAELYVTHAVIADSTDEKALTQSEFATLIVSS